MDLFVDFGQPMDYSYSSASNDSVQPSDMGRRMYSNELEMYSNGYALLYSSSADSSMSAGYQSSEQFDDFGTSLSLDMQSWHDGACSLDYTEPTQSYGIPVPRPNNGYGAQFHTVPHVDEVTTPSTYLKPGRHRPHTELEKPAKPFTCDNCGKAFTRVADVKRHQTSVHFPVLEDCPVDQCPRKGKNGFPRKDHLTEHLRTYHHMDIPKRVMAKRKTMKGARSPPHPIVDEESFVV
ncbi:hypothetical protein VTN77DRAFT_9811 [Rasamsonia byssochlamydoides]|uniref:uncharacterized protein n=1 Tax=Rasamsonia byssochlamydoides TaxID=89139 RepID=UPI003742C904